MLLRCILSELMKCRRNPVWLAFMILPLFPAVLGTFNYLGNIEVLQNGWYSLWTQHTLFSAFFFLPAQLSVFCAWQWRLEHTGHNWNRFMTAPVDIECLYLAKLIVAAGVSVLAQACIGALFCWAARWPDWKAPSRGSFELAGLGRAGRPCRVRRAAASEPYHPLLRRAGGHGPAGRSCGDADHGEGLGLQLPIRASAAGHEGQRPGAPAVAAAVCAVLRGVHRAFRRGGHMRPAAP